MIEEIDDKNELKQQNKIHFCVYTHKKKSSVYRNKKVYIYIIKVNRKKAIFIQ